MARQILHHRFLSTFLHRRPISTTTAAAVGNTLQNSTTTVRPPPHTSNPTTRTPLAKQFETCLQNLKPGFTQYDVVEALRSQPDPDLAFDIFRWTGQQRNYKHTSTTYLTILQITISNKRYQHSETLIEEILAGACTGTVPLYNSVIKFCCGRKVLFNRAFDVYKTMLNSEDAKPDLETYKLLLDSLLRRFNNVNVCFVYLRGVKSMWKQMKAAGVVPDTFVMNMVMKAHAKCGEVDQAVRVFNEMGLYRNEANLYSYCYLIHGLCEKGRVDEGLGFYKEMRGKGLVPKGSSFMILICSLAMEGRFDEAMKVVYDMLGESMSPDLLTYKTVVEGLCREGRVDEAFDVVEEFRKKDSFMNEKTYKVLLNVLRYVN
ncbi:putative tetratricopeptide-like helical domain superfamily [Helianthus debilis subsp. tardiflorus]